MADSGTYTPDVIARRNLLAQQLINMASDTTPIRSWTQGMARLVQGLTGGMLARKDFEQQQEGNKALAGLLSGNTTAPSASQPSSAPPQAALSAPSIPSSALSGNSLAQTSAPLSGGTLSADASPYGPAISTMESGGNYNNVTTTRNRQGAPQSALGKYGIMDFNVGPWSKEVLGQELTPQQFLSSPQAQDAIFKAKFGQYAQKYGPEGASRAWFAGEGGMNNPNARDALGTTVSSYAKKFAGLIGPTQANAEEASPLMSASLTPGASAFAPTDSPNMRVAQAFSALNPMGNPQAEQSNLAPPPSAQPNINMMAVRQAQPQIGNGAPQPAPQSAPVANPIAPQGDMRARVAAMLNNPNPYVQQQGARLAQMLIQQQMQPPEMKTLTDMMGGQHPYAWNPYTQQLTPLNVPGGAGVGSIGAGSSNDDLMKAAEAQYPGVTNRVEQLYRGEGAMPNKRQNPLDGPAMQLIQQVHPDWSMLDWKSKNDTQAKFASGDQAKAITSFNRVMAHYNTLDQTIDKLNNTGSSWVNAAINPVVAQYSKSFQDAQANFNTFKLGVATEMDKAMKSAGVPDVEGIREWKNSLDMAKSPTELHAAVRAGLKLLDGAMDAMATQWNNGMKLNPSDPRYKRGLDFLSPQARAAYDRLKNGAITEGENSAQTAQHAQGNDGWGELKVH